MTISTNSSDGPEHRRIVIIGAGECGTRSALRLGILRNPWLLGGVTAGEGVIPKSKLSVKPGQRVRAQAVEEPPAPTAHAAGMSPMRP